jgi:hypothetical protein
MDMSNFKHRKMRSDRLDTNRMVSIMSQRQSLSPTAQAAVKAHVALLAADSSKSDLHALSGPSFNAAIAQILTELKG